MVPRDNIQRDGNNAVIHTSLIPKKTFKRTIFGYLRQAINNFVQVIFKERVGRIFEHYKELAHLRHTITINLDTKDVRLFRQEKWDKLYFSHSHYNY